MKENVYCIYDIFSPKFDPIITESNLINSGIAEFKKNIYYFERLNSENVKYFNKYYLTLLDENIFKIFMKNWKCITELFNHSSLPDLYKYIINRKYYTFNQISLENILEKNMLELMERYFQNNLIIKNHLTNNKPKISANATFIGPFTIESMNKSELKVEWKNIKRRK